MKHIASCSFGKDSLAMLLLLINKQYPLDEVIFFDTAHEFQAIYDTRDMVLPLLQTNNIQYTELKMKPSFTYLMKDHEVNTRNGDYKKGYGWCGGICRWATTCKISAIEKQTKGNIEYIGIAHDELNRLKRNRNGVKLSPLAMWGMTEKDCLEYCYDNGYYWNEEDVKLYDILDRVSCWCCRNKNLKELKNIYIHLPNYWEKLKELQNEIAAPFYKNKKTIFDLEKRFAREIKLKESQTVMDI